MKKFLKIILWTGGSILGLIALRYLLGVGLGLLLFGSADPFHEPGESDISFTRYLPPTATEVHESAWADGFLPDYDYYLRARITREEFVELVRDLELTPHTEDREYSEDSWLSWSGHLLDEEWWTPSEDLEGTFVREGGTEWTFAKYEGGFLYFRSLDH